MTYLRLVTINWLVLALGLAASCQVIPAHAGELYLDAAGGLSQFLITTPDGDYRQGSLPHTFDTKSLAYKVELGWKFNERWSMQGGYVNLGTVKQSAIFVPDENYDAKTAACLNGCTRRKNYTMTDAYHGGELTVTRTFDFDRWAVHLKGGGAYLMHRFTLNVEDGSGASIQHYGQFPTVVMGAGGSYGPLYLELDYYHGLGGSNGFLGQGQGWPLSKEMLVLWFGFRLPLGG